ncbi:P-loop containing nucleoside triphosphate hydrolase protein [Mycena vitilis]|nr:P-loop containing nucleoside triphosphate hydrolase protein [Mycena vitilis]
MASQAADRAIWADTATPLQHEMEKEQGSDIIGLRHGFHRTNTVLSNLAESCSFSTPASKGRLQGKEGKENSVSPTTSARKRSRDTFLDGTLPSPAKRARSSPADEYLHRISITASLNAAQEEASRAAQSGNTCLLGAPRSGITTTLEYIAAQGSNEGSVLMIIPRKLFLNETKRRLLGTNAVVLTWSQFAHRLFPGHPTWTEYGLREARRGGCVPQWKASSVPSLVIVDGCQNLDPTQYWVLTSFLSLLARRGATPRLVIAGNPQEAIKDFCRGDVRFLERAPGLFPVSPHPWTTVCLESSFLPAATVECINALGLKGTTGTLRLQGSGEGPKPQVFDIDPGAANIESVAEILAPLILNNISSCALTAPRLKNLKNGHPLRRFIDKVNALGIPYAEPKGQVSDGEFVALTTEDLENDVLLVTNDHQLLGCRFNLVIVWDVNTRSRSNLSAVTLTRSSEHLVLLHFSDRGSLPHANRSRHVDFTRVPRNAPDRPKPPDSHAYMPSIVRMEAADSTAHIPPQAVDDLISKFLPFVEVAPPQQEICCPDSIRVAHEGSSQFIPVADINGTAVMMGLQQRFSQVPSQVTPVRQAILDHADRSGWTQRQQAFENHPCDWMDRHLAPAVQRAVDLISPDGDLTLEDLTLALESPLPDYSLDVNGRRVVLSGRPDAIITGPSGSRICELKFASALAGRHIVQTALYWLMDAAPTASPGHVFLANVRTGQTLEIECTVDKCNALLAELVRARLRPREKLPVDEFLAVCAGIQAEVEQQKLQRPKQLQLSIETHLDLNVLSCNV